jgi:hypothetical protein
VVEGLGSEYERGVAFVELGRNLVNDAPQLGGDRIEGKVLVVDRITFEVFEV